MVSMSGLTGSALSALDNTAIANSQVSAATLPTDSQITQYTNAIKAYESDQFAAAFTPTEGSAQAVLENATILGRNQSLSNVASDLASENSKVGKQQRDTYSRQAEINEWEAQNKLDTLFFLQIVFLYLTAVVISLYLRQIGLFPSSIVYMISIIGLLICAGILWNRASYTQVSRDKRYWNRRYLGLSDSGLSAQMQCILNQ